MEIYQDKNKSLDEIKEFWILNKTNCEEKIMEGQYYNLYTKNIFEKLDILTQIMETDKDDPNNQDYLERHR